MSNRMKKVDRTRKGIIEGVDWEGDPCHWGWALDGLQVSWTSVMSTHPELHLFETYEEATEAAAQEYALAATRAEEMIRKLRAARRKFKADEKRIRSGKAAKVRPLMEFHRIAGGDL